MKQGLPVAGYKPQSDENIGRVNFLKHKEEELLQILDRMEQDGRFDARWLAIGRASLEQAFMAINRSIFQPGRVKL